MTKPKRHQPLQSILVAGAIQGMFGLSLAVVLAMLGCSTPQPTSQRTLLLEKSAAERIVVAPVNIALPLPGELESSTEIVMQALDHILRTHGKSVEFIDPRQGRQLWLQSAREVQLSAAEDNFENAVRVFARKVGELGEFEALILPSLYVTNAQVYRKGAVRWDTATQKVEFVGQSKWEIEVSQIASFSAASILMSVFDRNGRKIHSKRTGLELIQHLAIQLENKKGHDKRTWALEDDIPAISDPIRVKAAISHSLFPYLPK